MKILVFVEKFMSPTLLFIYNEIQELSKTNDVLLVTTEHLQESKKNFPFEKLIVVPYNPNTLLRKIYWLLEKNDIFLTRKNPAFSKKINKVIDSFKPDIIHAHFGYESIILLDNLKNTKCPVFVTFHGYDASEMLRKKSYIKKLNILFEKFKVTPLYVATETCKDLINAGVSMSHGKLLYCGINTDYFVPSATNLNENEKFTFLQISSFAEKKGHTYTLKAFQKFLQSIENKNKYRLILAGGGAFLEHIKNETKQLGLDDYVQFTGMITYKETFPLLQTANVFLHHSVTAMDGGKEGIPTSIMEAMAMELPVISTLHAGIPELVEDGVNGYLVHEKDIDAYARRMKDSITWKKLPVNRQKVEALFSRRAHNKNLLDIYSGS